MFKVGKILLFEGQTNIELHSLSDSSTNRQERVYNTRYNSCSFLVMYKVPVLKENDGYMRMYAHKKLTFDRP